MYRPYRAWCGVVVGLGILVGCAKKPTETVSGNTKPAPGPTGGAAAGTADLGRDGRTEQPGTDWLAGAATAVGGKKAEGNNPGSPAQGKGPSNSSGTVEVAQCRFDTVEKTIAAAKGKVVLIDCWATWCGPCVASFPKLVEKHQKYAGKGLAVISLSTDKASDSGKVVAFLRKHNATFTNLQMPLDAAAQKGLQDKFAYRNAIPHAVLFDKAGNRVWAGHPMDPKLTQQIETELAKAGPTDRS